jgi:hypothetical protein
MPSPFPGMDPYLEGDMWQEFHGTLAHSIRQQLLSILPPRYVALLSKRYVLYSPSVSLMDLPDETRVIYPDVHVAETPSRVAEAAVVYGTHTNTPPSDLLNTAYCSRRQSGNDAPEREKGDAYQQPGHA